MKAWAFNVIAAWSQFWNAFWGGNRDQSFSSRSYEARLLGKWWGYIAVPVVNALFLNRNHCEEAYRSDDERTYSDQLMQ